MLAPLEIGLNQALHVREERLSTKHDACRLLYVSDIHLRNGRSDKLCRQVLDAVTRSSPDVVLLGGDLVDRPSELGTLSHLVGQLQAVAPVLAVGGNHDDRIGMGSIRDAVLQGGGQWIHEGFARVTHGRRAITVWGPAAAPDVLDWADPADMVDGVDRIDAIDGHVRVLCAHNPRIWKWSRHGGYDLVLAGHLHGCQLVACEFRDRLFPGALFYPYCFLSHQRGSTRLVVSRGVSDLLPIRWRCPREVVLCHV